MMTGRIFQPDINEMTMLVDSGATEHFLDDELIPGVKDLMMNPALQHVPQDSNNTSEEATVAEADRQRAQTQDGQLQRSSNPLEEGKSSTTAGASSTGAGVSSPGTGASSPRAAVSSTWNGASSAGTGTSSPGTGEISPWTATPSSQAGTPPQEAEVLSSSGARPFSASWVSPIRPGSHRVYRITRPPPQDPTQVQGRPSTARTPREHRGHTSLPRP